MSVWPSTVSRMSRASTSPADFSRTSHGKSLWPSMSGDCFSSARARSRRDDEGCCAPAVTAAAESMKVMRYRIRLSFRIMPLHSLVLVSLVAQTLAVPQGVRDRIDATAREIHPQVVEVRRDIHRHPELGFRETRTAALVAERLKALGYEVQTGIGVTGVVGVLK